MVLLPAHLDDSGQAEVGHLAGVVFSHKDIPGRQVSVDALLLLQVGHPISHLGTHVQQRGHVLVLALRTWNQPTTNQSRSEADWIYPEGRKQDVGRPPWRKLSRLPLSISSVMIQKGLEEVQTAKREMR